MAMAVVVHMKQLHNKHEPKKVHMHNYINFAFHTANIGTAKIGREGGKNIAQPCTINIDFYSLQT